MRFLSHHDMMRLFARACRRAALPVRLTQGFDPRPRLVFASALEVGVESLDEVLEVELGRWVPPERLRGDLDAVLPEGVSVHAARLLPPRRSGERAVEITYRVAPPGGPATVGATPQRIEELLASAELPFDRPREKRVQHLDLRPSLLSLVIESHELVVTLRPTERGAARPAEILALLTGRPLTETRTWKTTRTRLVTAP